MAILIQVLHTFLLASCLAPATTAAFGESESIRRSESIDFITACPGTSTYYGSPHGNSYIYCQNTNYVGPDTETIAGIMSLVRCINECSIRTGCPKVDWDRTTNVCHIKAREAQNSWVESDRFHSAFNRFLN
jgi:PAN domain-containing protein